MTKLTKRDIAWKAALDARREINEGTNDRYSFTPKDISERILQNDDFSEQPSIRTIRDVLISMSELGELSATVYQGRQSRFRPPKN